MSTNQYTPTPHGLKDLAESVRDIYHPWLTDLREMVRLLRGEIEPPHKGPIWSGIGFSELCQTCEDGRLLQAEGKPVADVEVLVDGDDWIGDATIKVDHDKTVVTRTLSLCKHGHLFTPCEWCEYDKLHLRETYRTFDEWHEMVGAEPDKVYGLDRETMESIMRHGQVPVFDHLR